MRELLNTGGRRRSQTPLVRLLVRTWATLLGAAGFGLLALSVSLVSALEQRDQQPLLVVASGLLVLAWMCWLEMVRLYQR